MFRVQTKLMAKQGKRVIDGKTWPAHVVAELRDMPRKIAGFVLTRLADAIIFDQCSRIRRGVTPGGQPQKRNSPFTQQLKASLGKPTTPLVWDGVLSSPFNYRRGLSASGAVTIDPPLQRESIIPKLRAQGYETFELPPDPDISRMFGRVMNDLPAHIENQLWDFWSTGGHR